MPRTIVANTGRLLLALGLAAGAAAARQVPFLAPVGLGTLPAADSVVAADLDRDGDLDLAAAFGTADQVVWLEDTGAGFVEHPVATTLDDPIDLAAADVDCDAHVDLVIVVRGTGEVVWRRNDGNAASWSVGGTISGAAAGVLSVAAGDLTGNGTVDVVGAGEGADEIVAWTQPSCGSAVWTATVVSSVLLSIEDVALADTDADGRLDIVGSGGLLVASWENDGGGSFTRVDVNGAAGYAVSVAAGDVDGDGDVDIAAASTATGLAWWANPGTAGAWTETAVGSLASARVVAMGDVDGDGDLDLVGGTGSGVPLSIFDNTAGDGSAWSAQELDASPGSGSAVLVADLGDDGDADVVAATLAAGVRSSENVSTGSSADLGLLQWTFYDYDGSGANLVDLETGDLNGDGLLDLVAVWEGASPANSKVNWYAGLGASAPYGVLQFEPLAHTIREGVVRTFESVALGDIDDDGDTDAFVGAKWFAGQAYAYCRNDGEGAAWTCFDIGPSAWVVDAAELADIDGDGDLDAVALLQEVANGPWIVFWCEQTGNPAVLGNWAQHTIAADGPFGKLEVLDLDRDADLDVVAGATWWRNDSITPPVWVAQSIPFVLEPPIGTSDAWALADVDRDGDPDVAAASSTSGIAWIENNLPGSWISSELFAPSATDAPAGDFTLADFDRDGDPDLIAGMVHSEPPAAPAPRLSWFENDVATDPVSWTEHVLEPPGDTANHLLAADFDRDGDPDLAMPDGALFESWLNGGGQFALEARGVVPASLLAGTEAAVVALDAWHRGRPGEAAMELAAVSLRFEEALGDPLTQDQLDALVAAVRVYRDDGSGAWDPSLDEQVGSFGPPALAGGEALLELADDLPGLQQAPAATPATYFVSVELTVAAGSAGVPSLTITHTPGVGCTACADFIPQRASAAENALFDLPLTQEVSLPVAATFAVLPVVLPFSEGFESGDTSGWSAAAP